MKRILSFGVVVMMCVMLTVPVMAVEFDFSDPWEVTDKIGVLSQSTKDTLVSYAKQLSQNTNISIVLYTDNVESDDYEALAKEVYAAVMPQATTVDMGIVILYSESPRGLGVAYGKDIYEFFNEADAEVFDTAVALIKLGRTEEALQGMHESYIALAYKYSIETAGEVYFYQTDGFESLSPAEQAEFYLHKGIIENEKIYTQLQELLPSLSPEQQKEVKAFLETYDPNAGYRTMSLGLIIAFSVIVAALAGVAYWYLLKLQHSDRETFEKVKEWYISQIHIFGAPILSKSDIHSGDILVIGDYEFDVYGDTVAYDSSQKSEAYDCAYGVSMLYLFQQNHHTDIFENSWIFYKSHMLPRLKNINSLGVKGADSDDERTGETTQESAGDIGGTDSRSD